MSKTSTARKALSYLPLYAQISAGLMPPVWGLGLLVAKDPVGPQGESLLHRFMLSGRADLACEWIRLGGSVRADDMECYPIHWLGSGGASRRMGQMLSDMGAAAEAFRASARALDKLGRDPAGMACLAASASALLAFLKVFPEAAEAVHLGVGAPLGLADALVACHVQWSDKSQWSADAFAEREAFARVVHSQEPPSRLVPECLSSPRGIWTQALWDKAVAAMCSDEQLARMEASDIAEASAKGSQGKLGAPRI